MSNVKRKVHFFKLEVLPDEDEKVPAFSIADALLSAGKLRQYKTSTGPKSRYADTKQGILCIWPDVTDSVNSGLTVRAQLGKIRRDDLPRIDSGGTPMPLSIAADEGLVEVTHAQFFAKNIVGVEFNFYGPRASSFPAYFESKFPDLPQFRLHPILNMKAHENLDKLEDIRLATFSVKPSEAHLLKAASKSIPDAFEQLEGKSDAAEIIITLKADPHQTLKLGLIDTLKRVLFSSGNPREDFRDFDVRGRSAESGKVETFDILKDRFVFQHEVDRVSQRSRGVNSTSMFRAIEESYDKHKRALEEACVIALQ